LIVNATQSRDVHETDRERDRDRDRSITLISFRVRGETDRRVCQSVRGETGLYAPLAVEPIRLPHYIFMN